jgi:hypothetical protein
MDVGKVSDVTSGRRSGNAVFKGCGLAVEEALGLGLLMSDHMLEVEVAVSGEASSLVALPLLEMSNGVSSAS